MGGAEILRPLQERPLLQILNLVHDGCRQIPGTGLHVSAEESAV